MKWLSAGLTFVNLSTVCGLLLGMAGNGLNQLSAILSLISAAVFALAVYLGTSNTATEQNISNSPAGKFSRASRHKRYRHVWLWVMAACFALFALRSFCWLLYIDGDQLRIQSPNNLGDLALHITFIKNFANGVSDARAARKMMWYLGAPSKTPIYFACDAFINPKNPSKLPAGTVINKFDDVIPYFNGLKKVLAKKRIGAYGPYTAIKGLFDRKMIKFGWLASSFDTNGRFDTRAHLYQCSTLPPDVFGSSQLDYTFALKGYYGQFKTRK